MAAQAARRVPQCAAPDGVERQARPREEGEHVLCSILCRATIPVMVMSHRFNVECPGTRRRMTLPALAALYETLVMKPAAFQWMTLTMRRKRGLVTPTPVRN